MYRVTVPPSVPRDPSSLQYQTTLSYVSREYPVPLHHVTATQSVPLTERALFTDEEDGYSEYGLISDSAETNASSSILEPTNSLNYTFTVSDDIHRGREYLSTFLNKHQ